MRIGDRAIGAACPPFVIAELGVNHDGSAERALELVASAARAGANAVKLQLFDASLLLSKAACLADYQRAAGERDAAEMLRRLELPIDAMAAVVDRAHALGVCAIVTVFSPDLVARADALDWDAYKSASPDIVNKPLLDALSATGRPLILSTGAATMPEVVRAMGWVGRTDRALLQCVSAYPTPDDRAELGGIEAIARETGLPTGYSDHTTGVDTGALAVAAGACILEKHFTHDRAAAGPDHAASLDADAFAAYARLARRAWAMLGSRSKSVGEIERNVRTVARQSVVARRALRAGAVLTRADLTVKRPGTGLEPWRLEELVGGRLLRDVAADVPLAEADVERLRAHGATR